VKIGVIVAILSGLLNPMINLSFAYGAPIARLAESGGTEPFLALNVIWAIAMSAGALVNASYCAYVIAKERNWHLMSLPSSDCLIGLTMFTGTRPCLYGVGSSRVGTLPKSGWPILCSMGIPGATFGEQSLAVVWNRRKPFTGHGSRHRCFDRGYVFWAGAARWHSWLNTRGKSALNSTESAPVSVNNQHLVVGIGESNGTYRLHGTSEARESRGARRPSIVWPELITKTRVRDPEPWLFSRKRPYHLRRRTVTRIFGGFQRKEVVKNGTFMSEFFDPPFPLRTRTMGRGLSHGLTDSWSCGKLNIKSDVSQVFAGAICLDLRTD
jgi:hypothetical protein